MAIQREGIVQKKKKTELIQTLPKIFKNRNEVDFAFNIIGEIFSLLRVEKNQDMRFPIELNSSDLYLNIDTHDKKGTILGFIRPKHLSFCKVEIMLQADVSGADQNYLFLNPEKPHDSLDIRIYRIPIEIAIQNKDDIYTNFKGVADHLNRAYKKPVTCSSPEKEGEQKALREILLNVINDLREKSEVLKGFPDEFPKNHDYSIAKCSEETCFDIAVLERLVRAIERKGQIIIYGAPGTGKTYLAEKLAEHLISDGNGFTEVVQFHSAYSYEDFIQGIRPQSKEGGGLEYPVVPGRFLDFCNNAELRQGTCVLIIDEINRADLARVFGELMYLLEVSAKKRRERDIPLTNGKKFRIPDNIRIIGTMNTADRSIALVDHALRRRFAFYRINSNYNILRNYHEKRKTNFPVERLIEVLSHLNDQINDPNCEVGISYFLQENLIKDIEDIWRMEIEPYLEEYYFDRLENVDDFRWEKIGSKILL